MVWGWQFFRLMMRKSSLNINECCIELLINEYKRKSGWDGTTPSVATSSQCLCMPCLYAKILHFDMFHSFHWCRRSGWTWYSFKWLALHLRILSSRIIEWYFWRIDFEMLGVEEIFRYYTEVCALPLQPFAWMMALYICRASESYNIISYFPRFPDGCSTGDLAMLKQEIHRSRSPSSSRRSSQSICMSCVLFTSSAAHWRSPANNRPTRH